MGQLPEARITPQPAFFTSGIDYAGPFLYTSRQGRGNTCFKCYICVFVCFTTHAVHLELLTDLTSQAFIAAFRRFVARRGKPQRIFSDNGTNFVGANRELMELGKFLHDNQELLVSSLANEGVSWTFIPPHSPHFGGIWEAGVKAIKYHLKRVMTDIKLTYEDFSTVLCQIESLLNSRPITPMSSDPSDLEALTPAHFIIGRKLTTIPDPSVVEICENRLSRFQRLQQIQQKFWQRWSQEYISELQNRTKWKINKYQLKLNELVLIKDDNLPSLYWKLGRIVQLHPGPDGVSRVATVRTQGGLIKRSFNKLCPLPLNDIHKVEEEPSTSV